MDKERFYSVTEIEAVQFFPSMEEWPESVMDVSRDGEPGEYCIAISEGSERVYPGDWILFLKGRATSIALSPQAYEDYKKACLSAIWKPVDSSLIPGPIEVAVRHMADGHAPPQAWAVCSTREPGVLLLDSYKGVGNFADLLKALGLLPHTADYRLAVWPNGVSYPVEVKFDDYGGYFLEAKTVLTGQQIYLKRAAEEGVVLIPLTVKEPLDKEGIHART